MRELGLGLLLLAFSVNGCGASQAAVAPADAPPSVAVESYGVSAAPAAPAPAFSESWGGGASKSMEPAPPAPPIAAQTPALRPGLGTEWGETRTSRIHDVSFERAEANHPFALASLHYNDRQGVEAMAAYHGFRGPRLREEPVGGGVITVSVRDQDNQPLEAVHLADRTFIIGEQGARYAIVLENHSPHRVEAVATVDGLDVMNGHAGSVANRGYVVEAYQTLTIDGFRQSQSDVAAFRFAKVADSYAARTGAARNVGVIGVAFFDERGDTYARWTPEELRRRDTANPFPSSERYATPPPVQW